VGQQANDTDLNIPLNAFISGIEAQVDSRVVHNYFNAVWAQVQTDTCWQGERHVVDVSRRFFLVFFGIYFIFLVFFGIYGIFGIFWHLLSLVFNILSRFHPKKTKKLNKHRNKMGIILNE
jgi:hypothetical protein